MDIFLFLLCLILGGVLVFVLKQFKIQKEKCAISEEKMQGLTQKYASKENQIEYLNLKITSLEYILDNRQKEVSLFEERSRLRQEELLNLINTLQSSVQGLNVEKNNPNEQNNVTNQKLIDLENNKRKIQEEIYRQVTERVEEEINMIVEKEQKKQQKLLSQLEYLQQKLNEVESNHKQEKEILLDQISMLTQRKRKLEEEIENYEDIGQKIIRKEQDKYSKSLNQIEELQQEKNKLVESFFKLSQERQELYKIIDYLQQLIRSQKDLIDKFEVAYKAVISQQFSLSEKYARLMKASDILLNRNIQIKPTTLKGVKEDTFSSTDSSDIWRDIRENG